MKQNNKLILLSLLLLCISCGRTYREEDLTQTTLTKEDSLKMREQQIKENLEKTNQIVINKEKERILSYIKRNAWQTKEIDGVFIEILKQSKGKKIQQGDIITLSYTCTLLDGTTIYDSQKDGKLHIKIGSDSQCPLGLQKALLQLKQDTHARVIIPSALAYGLSGDGNKVPRSATLIYEIKIEKVE